MNFYAYCNAKNGTDTEKVNDKDASQQHGENSNQEQEGLDIGKEGGEHKVEDGLFGLGNRSEAAKKGWETRKQHGWNPKVGLKESGSKIPTWHNGVNNASASNQQPKAPETKQEASKADDLSKNGDWRPPHGDIWDDRGKRNYFE